MRTYCQQCHKRSNDCKCDQTQGILFDLELGGALKAQSIDKVEDHADDEWKALARQAVLTVAKQRHEFCTDDIWRELGVKPAEPRAMGAVMRHAARSGLCEKTNRVTDSAIPSCHRRPVAVWRSLL